ncbi:hypothetical protein EDB84DRAFT_847649 [Lactarius hengduanensis]|nr:hypothetical protein EDB84DRAFT_847649 [Lactarius hengduanensis]
MGVCPRVVPPLFSASIVNASSILILRNVVRALSSALTLALYLLVLDPASFVLLAPYFSRTLHTRLRVRFFLCHPFPFPLPHFLIFPLPHWLVRRQGHL